MTEFVTIRKGKKTKEVPKAQWDAMKKNDATYGWSLASELPEEVLQKDKEVKGGVVESLKAENKDLKTKVAGLKATIGEKDLKIKELEEELRVFKADHDIKSENLKQLQAEQADSKETDNAESDKKEINLLEVYAEEVNASFTDLKKYAKDNNIDITGLKSTEALQKRIAEWLHENHPKKVD